MVMHCSQNLVGTGKSQTPTEPFLIIVYNLFCSDIGIEAIKRGGFAKFVDVRHLEGYPDVGRLESKG